MRAFSDEPVIVPRKGINHRLLAAVGFILLLIGLAFYLYQQNARLERGAHEAERGKMNGAVYAVSVQGQDSTIELGWAGDRLALVMEAPPAEGALVRLRGAFGRETLVWNETHGLYGPTEARMDPFGHHRVHITFEAGGEVLWAGERWAYGIHDHAHHGHAH